MTDQITFGSHMKYAPHATTPQTPPKIIESDQRAKPQRASRSTRTSHAPSRSANQVSDAAAAAVQQPYATKLIGTWSGYQTVRISGGGHPRWPGKASAAAIAAAITAKSGSA